MIKAIINNKDRLDDEGSINQNEDARTSMTFGRLLYLPEELLWTILTKACTTTLPKSTGKLLSVEFWPKWSSKDTNNSVYVEPDIFMRFDNFDLIIEAKKDDNGGNCQTNYQWENEIQSYLNEYSNSKSHKELFLLAIGGNNDLSTCYIKIQDETFTIHKCSWINLLHVINDYKEQCSALVGYTNYNDAILRIINDIIDVFHLYGDHVLNYMSELNDFNYSISNNSLNDIKSWTIIK